MEQRFLDEKLVQASGDPRNAARIREVTGAINRRVGAYLFVGVVIPVAVALGQFGDPGAVLWLLVALTAAQVVIGNVLDPYLMGSSLNLSPFAILLSKNGHP